MTYSELMAQTRAFMESRALLTAIELDVFSAVGEGANASRVATRIGADPRATGMLLNALCAIGALSKKGETFRNTPVTRRCLTGRPPRNERAAFLHTVNLWPRWSTLTEAVRKGTSVWRTHQPASQPAGTEAFIAAMHRNAATRAPRLVRAVGVRGAERMLDVGGGSGAYAIAFAKAAPGLKAEVLDRPEVLPIARRHIRQARMSGRVTVRAGDLRSDALGSGYDLVLVSAICHMLSPSENADLFRRVHAALAPGGRLVLHEFILRPDKTAPRAAVLFSLNMLVGTAGGANYSQPEYTAWLKAAGFTAIRRLPTPEPAGVIVAARAASRARRA
ncbi:MAG: methyltransferase domain-containing protein [Bryobacterales bacterium]|nr:methyltransferase domain-containing protein [Bryobacterales bacterium]